MDAIVWIVLAVAVVLVAGVVVIAARRRRSAQLQERFGPEYDRAVEQRDDRREAESELAARAKRRDSLDVRPLEPDARERYATEWQEIQKRFVDEPQEAVREADQSISLVMADRGYPVDDFEQRASDVSVDHPHVVENYRAAHGISGRIDGDEGASTEDLRQAMVHYRALFEELLADGRETDEVNENRRVRS